MIWKTQATLEGLAQMSKNTMVEHLGIKFTEIGTDYLKASMPIDHRTVQPFRLLHGGASVSLAETIGSVASNLCIDAPNKSAVGLEINANHLRAGFEGGMLTAIVKPIRLGRSIHVWNIEITDERDRMICISRLTMAIIETPKPK